MSTPSFVDVLPRRWPVITTHTSCLIDVSNEMKYYWRLLHLCPWDPRNTIGLMPLRMLDWQLRPMGKWWKCASGNRTHARTHARTPVYMLGGLKMNKETKPIQKFTSTVYIYNPQDAFRIQSIPRMHKRYSAVLSIIARTTADHLNPRYINDYVRIHV